MLDVFKEAIQKDEIVREEVTTIKMLVPFRFDLEDGKCINPDMQDLYDFLNEREDVKVQEVAGETESLEPIEETPAQNEVVDSYNY